MSEPSINKSLLMLPSPQNKVCLSLPIPTVQGYCAWAEKLFESHLWEEALVAYSECLRLDPSNENALYKRGLTKGHLKSMESSLSDLSSVLLQRLLKEAHFYKQNILEQEAKSLRKLHFFEPYPRAPSSLRPYQTFKTLEKPFRNPLIT